MSLRLFTRLAVAGFPLTLAASPVRAAETHQANLGTMPLDEAKTGKTLWERRRGTGVQGFPVTYRVGGERFVAATPGTQGGSPVQKPSTMLQEVHHSQTGQAVHVFALPKQH